MADAPGAQTLISRIAGAANRSDALLATTMLVDMALDGGVAPSTDAPLILTGITEVVPSAGEYAACLGWVALEVATTIGVWEKASQRHPAEMESFAAGIELEQRCFRILSRGLDVYRSMLWLGDAEARSVAYLLEGRTSDLPAFSIAALAGQSVLEKEELAAGCALQAFVSLLVRVPSLATSSRVDWIRRRIATASDSDRGRLALLVGGRYGAEFGRSALKITGPVSVEQSSEFWLDLETL